MQGLYDFTNQKDPDRILNRLKRLERAVPQLRGGKQVTPLGRGVGLAKGRNANDPSPRVSKVQNGRNGGNRDSNA